MAEDQESNKKRRLRAPAETLHEKSEKAQEISAQPKRKGIIRRIFTIIFWPFRIFGWLAHKPPFKQIGHGLHWFFTLRFMRFLGKILGIKYLHDSFSELKLVTWPSRKQSRQLTTAVIIFSVIFGGIIAMVDLGLNKLFKEVLLK